ncbi:MAG: Cys-tRNA(Pro) deacylase [Bacilli bacterium]|nr:Cys-tRNA(Pro) deacylase [Bacilli bacterium]
MRILSQLNIDYQVHTYPNDGNVDGVHVANLIGIPPERVFKTLVTEASNKTKYVFLVPVLKSLDLKKAAKEVNVKSIALIKQKELLALTGYIHGGCSPIGMKKAFSTVIDSSALTFSKIVFSAGKIGYQIEMSPNDIENVFQVKFADVSI